MKSTTPMLSVGLPVYNGENFLSDALESLLAQSFTDFEIIVSDNCSNDGTAEICQRFLRRDDRIRYYRNETNLGAAGNFNGVVGLARGHYFCWACHDDLWHPDYFETCIRALESDPGAVLAYSRACHIDAGGEQSPVPLLEDLGLDHVSPRKRLWIYHNWYRYLDSIGRWSQIEGLYIPVCGIMIADVLGKTDLIGPYIDSDAVLIEQMLMKGKFLEIPEYLFSKRHHEKRSVHHAYDQRTEWFSGTAPRKLMFPKWRILKERLKSAVVAPRAGMDKLYCTIEMVWYYIRRPHQHRALVKEVLINFVRFTRLDRIHFIRKLVPGTW